MELETNRIDKRKNNEIRPFSIYPYNFYFYVDIQDIKKLISNSAT
mgnify:CR=1 FL=1|jgi:hypothetical protein